MKTNPSTTANSNTPAPQTGARRGRALGFFVWHSVRTIFRNKTYSILNLAGLAIGLAMVLMMTLMVYNEYSFDRSFAGRENIFRLNSYLLAFMPGETFASTSNKTGPYLQEQIPDIQTTVRTYRINYTIRISDQPMKFAITWADEDFFRLFEADFTDGTPDAVMKQPGAIAISESMAKNLFGNDDPMGKTFRLDDKFVVEVKAVYKDFPENTSFREYRAIAPFMHSYPEWLHTQIHWGNIDYETFCMVVPGADIDTLGRRIEEAAKAGMGEQAFYVPQLQNLEDIHLYSAKFRGSRTSSQSDIAKVKTMGLLAVIILLVACVNYMNLSTARAQKRAKEIGVCKALGAKRGELIGRLTLETAVITTAAFILAAILALLLLPIFNTVAGQQLSLSIALRPSFLLGALLVWILTTLVAASYPALYMSGFPAIVAIRQGSAGKGNVHATVRKILSAAQFAVAVVLISWVVVIQAQIRYTDRRDIGYNPHNLLGFGVPKDRAHAIANELRAYSGVESLSLESGNIFSGNGNVLVKNADDKTGIALWSIATDDQFINTMQLKLIAGNHLPLRAEGDTVTQVVLNRRAVEYLETTPEEIIGKTVLADIGEKTTVVCGVVENFNFEALYKPIVGFCIHNGTQRKAPVYAVLRVKGAMKEHLAAVENIVKKHAPEDIFTAQFPDETWAEMHRAEQRTSTIVSIFSLLAVFVACMGVFGLTAFMAEQRTKEIGIRKVLGASVRNIVSLFTVGYMKLLLLSLLVALPVAWRISSGYLDGFAYRITLSWWMFAAAAAITVAVTLLTVCFRAIKAATVNPVNSIKVE